MKMYERYLQTFNSILLDFCYYEGVSPGQVTDKSRDDDVVKARDRFYAYAFVKGMSANEMAKITGRSRPNFYKAMNKSNWHSNVREFEQVLNPKV